MDILILLAGILLVLIVMSFRNAPDIYTLAKGVQHPRPDNIPGFTVRLSTDEDVASNIIATPKWGDTRLRGQSYAIEYRDMYGNETSRLITVNYGVDGFGDPSIHAWCHERRAPRQFKVGRIARVIDVATGEVLDTYESISALFDFEDPREAKRAILDAKYEEERKARKEKRDEQERIRQEFLSLVEPLADEVVVLLFTARADGRVSSKEKDVILEFCYSRAPQLSTHKEEMGKWLKRMYPDPLSFTEAIKEVKKLSPDKHSKLLELADKVISAVGKKANDNEILVLNAIKGYLGVKS